MALSAHDVCFKLQYPLPPKRPGQRGSPTQSEMVVPKTVPHFLGEDVALFILFDVFGVPMGTIWVPLFWTSPLQRNFIWDH